MDLTSHIFDATANDPKMVGSEPIQLVIENGVESEPLARAILEAFPETPRFFCPPEAEYETRPGDWFLRRHKGRFVKPCPGTRKYLCCGYYVLNLVLGCPFGCVYCVLPDYYGHRGLTIFVNLEDALWEVKATLKQRGGITRVGTGEWTDSLALEPWFRLSARLVPFFRDVSEGILELKTKSTYVDALLDLPHGNHTVISWSLNPSPVIQRAEPGTPSLAGRLEAARRCQERGYPVGLHFDPMVWSEDWEDRYYELLRQVFQTLDPQGILWISLGALRYPPSLQKKLLPSGLGLEELLPGLDGKLRYLRPLRTQMFRSMVRWIRELGGDLFIYLCMESPEVWRDSVGRAPRGIADLDREFEERIRGFWSRTHESRSLDR